MVTRVSWWKVCVATVMSLVLPKCILISCSSVFCVLMALGIGLFVKVMSALISVMNPLLVCALCLCVWWCIFGVLAFCVSFVSCIVMMSGWVLCTRFLVPRFCF